MATPAIFLDRDGVLNENYPTHVKSWSEFRFLPQTLNAVKILSDIGIPMIVVTNQAIVNRGWVRVEEIEEIHRQMIDRIRAAHGRIDRVYLCPHRPDEGCSCRKPAPGMLLQAAMEHDIDLAQSVFVGDAVTDVIAGQQAGCRTILVQTGRGQRACRELRPGEPGLPDAIAGNLYQAVPLIMEILDQAPNGLHPVPAASTHLALLDSTYLDQ